MSLWLWVRSAPRLVWPPVVVFVLHLIRQILWPELVDLDMVAHFFGGLSIAWMTWNIYRFLREHDRIPTLSAPVLVLCLVSIAVLVGVAWEWMEYYILMQWLGAIRITLADSMLDLVLDAAGAVLFPLIVILRYEGSPLVLRRSFTASDFVQDDGGGDGRRSE